LAQINIRPKENIKAIASVVVAKLLFMPLLCLGLLLLVRPPYAIAFLLLLECAVPSATSLSLIIRHYKKEDLLVSQGIFLSHIASLVTLPLFLSLYFMRVMVK